MNRRGVLSSVLELVGVALIAFALLTIAWQIAAIWVGVVLIVGAFALDGPTAGGDS